MIKELRIMFVVLMASTLVAFFIAKTYIPKANLLWDEAHHVYNTYRIYESLEKRDFLLFWENTLTQVHYPFLQSWFFGPLLLLFGFSIEKLRILGLFWFVACSLLLFILGKRLGGKKGNLMGFFSSFLFLTSPMMIFFSSLFMREMMGAALVLIILLIYFLARKKSTPSYYLLTGLLLLILALTKYNYAILLVAALFLEGAINFIFTKKRAYFLLSHLCIFAPFLIGILFWAFFPENKTLYILRVIADPAPLTTAAVFDFWTILTFYPKLILTTYSPSAVIGFFLLVSFFLAPFYFSNYTVRVLWLGIAINLFLGMSHFPNMQGRYILITMPLLFLIGAFVFVRLWEKASLIKKRIFRWGVILGAGILFGGRVIFDLLGVPSFIYSMAAHTSGGVIFNHLDYQDTTDYEKGIFNLEPSSWPKKLPSGDFEKPSNVIDFVTASLDLSKPVEAVVGVANEFPFDAFNIAFSQKRKEKNPVSLPYSSFVVTIEIFPTSRYFTNDYKFHNLWQLEKIREIEKDFSLVMINKKKFEELDVEVKIYGRK